MGAICCLSKSMLVKLRTDIYFVSNLFNLNLVSVWLYLPLAIMPNLMTAKSSHRALCHALQQAWISPRLLQSLPEQWHSWSTFHLTGLWMARHCCQSSICTERGHNVQGVKSLWKWSQLSITLACATIHYRAKAASLVVNPQRTWQRHSRALNGCLATCLYLICINKTF